MSLDPSESLLLRLVRDPQLVSAVLDLYRGSSRSLPLPVVETLTNWGLTEDEKESFALPTQARLSRITYPNFVHSWTGTLRRGSCQFST